MSDHASPVCAAPPHEGTGLVHDAARRIGALPGLALAQRRSRFLRALAPHMGPAQFEHLTIHSEQVGRTAGRLAGLMRVPALQVERIRLAGLMHDLGKALVPDRILGRGGPLDAHERLLLSRHEEDGADLCELLGAPPDIIEAVRAHHRRADGADTGQAPPLGARIIRVADALAVMTTGRSYSAARTYAQALAELRRARGTEFDPDVVVAAHILGASVMALAA